MPFPDEPHQPEDFPGRQPPFPQQKRLMPGKKFSRGSFHIITVTPRTIDYVNTIIDRSADYDRALKENPDAALDAYGDLMRAKGALVKFIASLMDLAKDQNLNKQRTTQVRFS